MTENLDTDTNNTGYDSPDIWIEDNLIHNTELDNFIQAVFELTTDELPINRMKHLSQWFKERYVGETKTKMPPGLKSNIYLDDIVIYSEEQTGGTLAYMRDKVPHYVKVKDDSRWYPKIWQEWTKPGNNKKRYPNSHSPDEGKSLAGTWLHAPPDAMTVWARFQMNKTRQGPLGKFPAGN